MRQSGNRKRSRSSVGRAICRLRADSYEMRQREYRKNRFASTQQIKNVSKKPRIAHPGGKITHNKEEALQKYLLRANLTPIQQRALRGIRILNTKTVSRRKKSEKEDKDYKKIELLCLTRQWLSRCSFMKTLDAFDKDWKRMVSSVSPKRYLSLIEPISMIYNWLVRTGFRDTASALISDLNF